MCAPWSWGLSHHAQQLCHLWLCTHHSLNLLHQIRVGTVQSSQCWKGISPEWSLNCRRMCAVQAKVMLSVKTWPLKLQFLPSPALMKRTTKKSHLHTPHFEFLSRLTFFPKPPNYAPKRKLKLGLQQSFPCFLCFLSAGFWAALTSELCCLSCLFGRSLLVKTLGKWLSKEVSNVTWAPLVPYALSSLSGEAVPTKIVFRIQ